MRRGCSSVGGNTSRMPPRTANSPRFSTSSTRAYAAAARASTISSRSTLCPGFRETGSRSPRPLTCGWSTDLTGATTTETGPVSGSSGRGWARRRSTARRRPTVSLRGLSRSCGRVSQEGYSTTPAGGRRERRAAARSSASRPVAVTASTGRPVSRARAATAKGRAAGGPTRSTCMRLPSAAALIASARAASLTTASSRPCRLIRVFSVQGWATRRARHAPRAGGSPAYDAARPGGGGCGQHPASGARRR